MARFCCVTGKKPLVGCHVSHAHNRTKRRFLPNLQPHRLWVESQSRWVKINLSAAGLRLVDKIGVEAVLERLHPKFNKTK